MTTDIFIDGMLSGTGVRDAIDGGYLEPAALGLSGSLSADIVAWQRNYEEAHFAGFPNDIVSALDREGIVLASRVQAELCDRRIGCYSNGCIRRPS